jgi:hypothetical protein
MINRFVIGYRERLKRDQADIVKLAYQTAAFTNSKSRPKSLSYYINKIMNSDPEDKDESTRRIQWAKEMDKKVEEAKRKEAEKHVG